MADVAVHHLDCHLVDRGVGVAPHQLGAGHLEGLHGSRVFAGGHHPSDVALAHQRGRPLVVAYHDGPDVAGNDGLGDVGNRGVSSYTHDWVAGERGDGGRPRGRDASHPPCSPGPGTLF